MESNPEQRTIRPEDLLRFQFLHSASLSPDGKTVAYVLSHVDAAKEEEQTAIWTLALDTGVTNQLTSGLAGDSSPEWSPDGKQIAFLSGRSGKPQIHLIRVGGGEARCLTSLEQGAGSGPVWSPDGKTLAFTAGPVKPPIDPAKPYRVTRSIYRFDGMGLVDNAIQDLYIIPVESGEARQLIHNECMNSSPAWSPDGTEILFSTSFFPQTLRFMPALHVTDLEGNERVLVEEWGVASSAAWTPDGKKAAFLGQPFGRPIGSKDDLWVIDRQGGDPECRTASISCAPGGGLQGDMASGLGPRLFIDDSGFAYINVQDGGTVQVYRVALAGDEQVAPVITGERAAIPVDLKNGQLIFGTSTFNRPWDLFAADIAGKNEAQLTHVNADLLAEFRLPTVEHLLFTAVDGAPLEGWLLKPPTGEPPFPTVLYIHGGPHSGFGNIFSFDFQMLAGAGYAVLAVNQRGSTGYGDAFATKIIADWGNLDYKDLMSGVDAAVERGLADPDRLGVCGISGGGNLSCWIVGQTDRFKAAVPENPVTNWFSMYGNGDLSRWFAAVELGGKPHEVPEVYTRCSPITYAHNCKTPTLLLQGECDYRCPAEQSEQFYSVLKDNGCIVEMVRFPGSPHAGSIVGPLPVRKAQNDALLDWMNRYVLGLQPDSAKKD